MAMVQSLQYLFVVSTTLFTLSFHHQATSSSHRFSKSLHFTLYEHDTFNKTSFRIVAGVAGQGFTATTAPFGSLFVNHLNNFTVTPDPSSKVVGTAEAISVTSSFDGLNYMIVSGITLSYKNLNGSISIVGNWNSIKLSDVPIVGGTGDFLFVQGYLRYSPIDPKGFSLTYKVEFHLYWPPYAK